MRTGFINVYQNHNLAPKPDKAGLTVIYKLATDGQIYSKSSTGVVTSVQAEALAAAAAAGSGVTKVTVPYTAFDQNTGDYTIPTPPGAVLSFYKIKINQQFSGGLTTGARVLIGGGSLLSFKPSNETHNQSVGGTAVYGMPAMPAMTQPPTEDALVINLSTIGDDIVNLTAGSVDVYYKAVVID